MGEGEIKKGPSRPRARDASESSDTYDFENIHRLLVDSVRDYAIFALDSKGYVRTWNEGAKRIKGYNPSEIIGRHFSTFYPPEAVAAGKPDYELMVAEAEGRIEDEGWRLRKDGSSFWANVVITALRDDTGRLVGFAKVTRDLTERRLAEQALKESEERFRLIVHSARDYGIFMLDPWGRVASWNEGAEHIKGYTAQEIMGRHFSAFYPTEDVSSGKPQMELRVAAKEGRFEDEGWRVRKDGTLFWANVVITALRNPYGELIGYAKVTRDLTERRASHERAIADARRIAAAEGANRTKAEFLTSMSHELRTPLNAIGGYVDILKLGVHGAVNEQQLDDLERIRSSQQHLLGIINDLLNFTRIEAGRLTYDLAPVALFEIIGEVRPMLERQAASKAIDLEWPSNHADAVAYADAAKVKQIVLNLLSNAVKFTSTGGRILIGHVSESGRVGVRVSDTGMGIAPENLESIFEPFVQVGRSLTSSQEGAGLGLSISRELARAMNGALVVESTLGAGSTFTLLLPRAT